MNAFLAEHAPPVLDPFAGGGSIPLEAQRLGLRAYASDLNPVPVLINKALIEIPPKFAGRPPVNPASRAARAPGRGSEKGKKKQQLLMEHDWPGATGLAEDVRYYGQWMRDEAEKRIGHLYPKVEVTAEMAKDRPDLLPYVGQKLTVIAWLWARTVASPNPAANGAHVPLVRSYWLSTKKGKEAYAQPIVDRANNRYRFDVRTGTPPNDFDPKKGSVIRTGGTCLLTGSPIPFDHVRAAGKAGHIGVRLMALVAEGQKARLYLPPLDEHRVVAESATPHGYPDTDLPEQALGFRVQNYGINKHHKLFTDRQLVAMTEFSNVAREARQRVCGDAQIVEFPRDHRPVREGGCGVVAYADAIATYLAFAQSKACNRNTNLCIWESSMDRLVATFSRQALSMIWDFVETNPFAGAGGDILGTVESVCEVIDNWHEGPVGAVAQIDARNVIANDEHRMICCDPPYYDNIAYADLSDVFYVWLRRTLGSVFPELLATVLTPKSHELIASPYQHDGSRERAQSYFEKGLGEAFGRMREVQASEWPLSIFYAFKQSEAEENGDDMAETANFSSTGWETMLEGVRHAGFLIDGTWPIRTEQPKGHRAHNRNALASSIVLVCRPRPANASLATRKEFLTSLRRELPDSLRNLQRGNIAPVDLAQAAIGPGMAVFTRYAKVIESDGSPMTIRTALGIINQSLDEVLAEQEGEFDGDTRWALAWFEQFGMDDGPFGDAETLSKAKNTAVNGLVEAGIITAHAGKVRLVKRDELPADWNPDTDKRLTVWETAQHLIRTLDQHGELRAAALVQQLGGMADISRDLAYRLYSTCERKKWAAEAMAYNGLVIAWPELSKLAVAERHRGPTETQREMF